MTETAIVGLGAMGLGMARNILKAGIALRGFDLSPRARELFAAAGGEVAGSAAEAAEGVSLLLLMVVNAGQAEAVLFEHGAAEAMAPGGTVILSATVAPAEARALGARLEERQMHLLDAPVSGGQVGAEGGTLTVMASGAAAAFDRAAPVLEAVSAQTHRLGDAPGMGATYKVVHQLAAGVHIAVAAELMTLGERAGCDPKILFDIVMASAGQSWMLGNRGPRMMQDAPEVSSSVDIFVKDMGLVLQTGRDAGAAVPLADVAHRMFLAARDAGHGSEDDSQVIRAYRALNGGSRDETA